MPFTEYGPHTWEVCPACNYNRHVCPGCGTDLTHAEAQRGSHCSESSDPATGKWAYEVGR